MGNKRPALPTRPPARLPINHNPVISHAQNAVTQAGGHPTPAPQTMTTPRPATQPGAATPAGPTGPSVYFNPLSSTLWSDSTGADYSLPGDTSNLNFMDGKGLLDSSMGKEAAFFYNQGQGQYQLNTALRPFDQKLDELAFHDPKTGKTMYDNLWGQAQDQWQHKADGTMSSAAQRGIYDSGMRLDDANQLATERSNAQTDLDKAYGATAVADLGKQKNDARESWVGQWLQQFIPYYNNVVGNKTALEVGGGSGLEAPASPVSPSGGSTGTTLPASTPKYVHVYVPNGSGGHKIGLQATAHMTPAQLKAALASPLNKK